MQIFIITTSFDIVKQSEITFKLMNLQTEEFHNFKLWGRSWTQICHHGMGMERPSGNNVLSIVSLIIVVWLSNYLTG